MSDSTNDSLPRSRPRRRSDRRPSATMPEPAQAPVARASEPPRAPEPAQAPEATPGALATALQATAELAEIGLRVTVGALRRVADRLPRP